ncbi:MAG: DUF2804 domain-containing protein [Bacilli bacterium]
MNKELSKGRLLDAEGNLKEAGFAYSLIKDYSRKDIKGLITRIKEWDYYCFLTNEYGIALTIDDNSYMSMVSVSFLDFRYRTYITKSLIKPFSFGKVKLPSTSTVGNIVFEGKKFSFSFLNDGKERKLKCSFKNFTKHSDFSCDLIVHQSSDKSMVIATPFAKKKHFYYNQKINNLVCNGTFKIGEREYKLENALGVLDWGRGTWTYNNTWYWGSCSFKDKEGYKGFNLGYGFGDTSNATENMAFFNDKAYKLNDVKFLIPKNEKGEYIYTKTWRIVSEDNSINMEFAPLFDRHDDTNVIVLCSLQHQVYGYFTGTIKAGRKIIKFDHALGFAERVTNKW